jgi:hypothetical protein
MLFVSDVHFFSINKISEEKEERIICLSSMPFTDSKRCSAPFIRGNIVNSNNAETSNEEVGSLTTSSSQGMAVLK